MLKVNLQHFAGSGVQVTTSDSITIEVNGLLLAGVQNYDVDYSSNSKRHDSFGQKTGVGWSESEQEYTINLSKLMLSDTAIADGMDFFDLIGEQFNVIIDVNGTRTVYTSCSAQSIKESGDLKSAVMESLTVKALGRTKS